MADLSVIEHVVVLMMENRSFDCLLGKLYPASIHLRRTYGNRIEPGQRQDLSGLE